MKKRFWFFLILFAFGIVTTLGTSYAPTGQSVEIQRKSKSESEQQRPPNKLERLKQDKERYNQLLFSYNPMAEVAVYSSQVELVGVWPYGSCRTTALDTSRNIALIASGLAVQVLDISTPASPVAIGEVVFDNYPKAIAISGNYAYVCAQDWYTGLSMLKVIDITDPTDPAEINEVSFSGWGAAIDISSNILCVAAESGGLKIFDITDPSAPAEVGTYMADENWVYDVALWSDYALIVNDYYDPDETYQMRVVNISSPASPVLTGTHQAAYGIFINGIDTVPSGIACISQYDWKSGTGTKLVIFDVATTPGVPAELGSHTETAREFADVEVQGDYAYTYDYWNDSLIVVNISDPTSTSLVGEIWSMGSFADMDLSGNYVGISAGRFGFELYDVTDPTDPLYVALFETPDDVDDVVVSGDYAYLGNRWNGLRILDISDPTNPTQVGLCDSAKAYGRIAVSGDYAYCSLYCASIYVVDISDPSAPTQVGYYDDCSWQPDGILVQGDHAYLVGTEWDWSAGEGFARMDILDISNPASPSLEGTYTCAEKTNNVHMVAISGQYAYLPVTDSSGGSAGPGLRIVDILDPKAPNEIGSFKSTDYGTGFGVAVRGDYAFLTGLYSFHGFRTIDISDPTSPSEIASIMSFGKDIVLSGSYAYLGDVGGLTLIDISDPANPVEAGYYFDSIGGTLDVSNGNHAYCSGSLVILKNLLAPEVELTAPSPGSTVSGTVALSADATHTSGISKVEFYVDGVLEGTVTTSPYTHSWDTTAVANGTHSIRARAYNNDGKSSDTEEIEVTVYNVVYYRLTIAAGEGGTTDPVPGDHDYPDGTPVDVTAYPDSGYNFNGWSGDVPSGHEKDNPVTIVMGSNKSITAHFSPIIKKDDILGTWSSGVWYRNSETGAWVNMSSTANLVAAGDLDGDGTDDLIGVWSSGLWVKYSSSKSWAKLSTTLPTDIASGDMNGDGRADVLGTWASGVWYRNTVSGAWVKMTTASRKVAAGDVDGDGTDDLIGVWGSGLWVKYSSTSSWLLITSSLPTDIASGDMNGDGRDDILGTWPSGVWYRSSIGGSWVKMSTPASLVAAGDIDGDGADDLIGTWSSGLWVKHSSTSSWQFICTSLPGDIDSGLFRTGWSSGTVSYEAPIVGVNVEEPGSIGNYEDLSSEGPGGWNFVYQEEKNLTPQEKGLNIMRVSGPGEPGFMGIGQKNLYPEEKLQGKKERKK